MYVRESRTSRSAEPPPGVREVVDSVVSSKAGRASSRTWARRPTRWSGSKRQVRGAALEHGQQGDHQLSRTWQSQRDHPVRTRAPGAAGRARGGWRGGPVPRRSEVSPVIRATASGVAAACSAKRAGSGFSPISVSVSSQAPSGCPCSSGVRMSIWLRAGPGGWWRCPGSAANARTRPGRCMGVVDVAGVLDRTADALRLTVGTTLLGETEEQVELRRPRPPGSDVDRQTGEAGNWPRARSAARA